MRAHSETLKERLKKKSGELKLKRLQLRYMDTKVAKKQLKLNTIKEEKAFVEVAGQVVEDNLNDVQEQQKDTMAENDWLHGLVDKVIQTKKK